MPYKHILILLSLGVIVSFLASMMLVHSGLTFTTPRRTVYVSFNWIFAWMSLTACSLVAGSALLLKLYRLFKS